MASQSEIADSAHVVTSKQIDLDNQKMFSHPDYRFITVNPNTFGQAITLSSSQVPVTFNLPPEVFNLSESYLQFQVSIPLVANQYIWTYEDVICSAISHIQHYCASNSFIVDIDNLQNYLRVVVPKELALDEFQSQDRRHGLYPSNTLSNSVPALRQSVAGTPNPASVNYVEPARFACGALGTAVTLNVQLPLRLIKNSLFSIDKSLYYGQLSYLRLYFGPLSKIGYSSTSNQSPSDGALSQLPANTSQILNLQLQLAIEGNQTLRNKIVEGFLTKGIHYYIPWVQSYKTSNSGQAQTVSLQFDVGNGQSLMKVYHSVFNNTEQNDTAYDNTNLDSTLLPTGIVIPATSGLNQKVRQFYTMLNGKRQQDITVDCQSTGFFTDYVSMRKMLRGSVIQNLSQYQYSWFWCDDFCSFGASADQEGREELICGVPLGAMPLTWTFMGSSMYNSTGNNSYQHYSYAVFQKKLTALPNLVKAE